MRDIKFRGKIKNSKVNKWVYGYLVDECHINEKNQLGYTPIRKETIGQYAGLKDKNGKEIYEEDIIKIKHKFDNTEYICEIIYIDGAFRTKKFIFGSYYDCLYYWYANDCEIEVIGNIYDNPELLEEGE